MNNEKCVCGTWYEMATNGYKTKTAAKIQATTLNKNSYDRVHRAAETVGEDGMWHLEFCPIICTKCK